MTINDFIQNIGVAPFAIKRLSANDMGTTGGHQVGVYLPKEFAKTFFPNNTFPSILDPDVVLSCNISSCNISSHNQKSQARIIYYNSKIMGTGTRDETRITCLAGTQLQNNSSVGKIAIFVNKQNCIYVWVCCNAAEEQIVEQMVGHPIALGDNCVKRNC